MSKLGTYAQGGDAQAIQKIAHNCYGSYATMFEVLGWPERGAAMMPAVQSRVVERFGSIRAFDEAHGHGDSLFPLAAINSDPPRVWLTSLYGFTPEEWGLMAFPGKQYRQHFLKNSVPGTLMVVYGASGSIDKRQKGKIIGMQQCTHEIGPSKSFMSPREWLKKERNPNEKGRWEFGVRIERAWRVTPETFMDVREFAPIATQTGAWQTIGSYGVQLRAEEARNILKLDLQETSVFGGPDLLGSVSGPATEVLRPSKPGPVSQSPFVCRESEGPKHLYVLQLVGDTSAFLGEPAQGKIIVKAGLSRSPQSRCDDFNRALPDCAFRWEILHSGPLSGFEAHPSSDHAKAGEKEMQTVLCTEQLGRSLGGEFFLAEPHLVDRAWKAGNLAAKAFSK